jgi:predicted Zn-dependent protease
LLQRATLYINAHKLRKAQLDVDRVLALQPDSAHAHYLKAELLFLNGDYLTARQELNGVLSRQPDNIAALDLLARTYTAQKQISGAIEAVRRYAASRPSSVPVQEFFAQMLAAHGDLEQSRKIFERLRNNPAARVNAEFALAQIDQARSSPAHSGKIGQGN